jgi:hypothetical protein
MKIKLSKNWRYGGQVNMAGTELEIKNEETISYLKENGFIYKEKKEKKSKVKVAKENN